MTSLKISPKLLHDLQSKNITIPKLPSHPSSNPKPFPLSKELERKQSFNSSDSLEKTNTTINFKIRPCTPNPDSLLEKKTEVSINNIRSAKTTLTTFPSYKKEPIVTEKDDLQLIIQEDDENLFAKEITEENLAELTSTDLSELHFLRKLNIRVDLSYNSLQNLGFLLPNLRELKINGSKLGSLRDIGTSLMHLEILWASRCSMQDLSGIMMFQNLKELYVSFNNIKDLTDIGFLENLQVLDLEGNEIDMVNLEYLQPLKRLYSLNLIQNPITNNEKYPKCVIDIIESLEILDEKPKDAVPEKPTTQNMTENIEEIDESLEDLLKKFGKYKAEINISEIKMKAENLFEDELKKELKEEDLILYSIKKSLPNKASPNNDTSFFMSRNKIQEPIRPKTASIFRPKMDNPSTNFDNGMSSLVSSNDVAFFGNPLKIFKHKRTTQVAHEEEEDIDCAPTNLINLINEFKVEKSSDDIEDLDDDDEDSVSDIEEKDEDLSEKEENQTNNKIEPKTNNNNNVSEKIQVLEKIKIPDMQKRNTSDMKPLKTMRSLEETKSAMVLKMKPEIKTMESEKFSAILNANKEKMRKNLGNLLNSKNQMQPANRIKLRQNIMKKAESFQKNMGNFFNKEGKDLKSNNN